MAYKPRTSSEINIHKIEVAFKKLNKGVVLPRDVATELNKRFDRLEKDNIGMYEDLYPKYIQIMRSNSA
jgi:hypothetical protein